MKLLLQTLTSNISLNMTEEQVGSISQTGCPIAVTINLFVVVFCGVFCVWFFLFVCGFCFYFLCFLFLFFNDPLVRCRIQSM